MKKLMILLVVFPVLAFAHPGVGIVMDRKGNVFYTDLKQIWKIGADGKKSIAVPNVHSHELFMDSSDNLFGEHLWYEENKDTWGHYVWKLAPPGKLTKEIPDTKGFLTNYSFVRDHHGAMFFADGESTCRHVKKKITDQPATNIGDACLNNIRWMTTDHEGSLYLIDMHDIKKIDANGHTTTLTKNLPLDADKNEIHALMGISVDKNKNVYVADYNAHAVKKITPSGQVSTVVKTNSPWTPTGQFIAPNGDFWLLECSPSNEVRVERIRSNGERTIF